MDSRGYIRVGGDCGASRLSSSALHHVPTIVHSSDSPKIDHELEPPTVMYGTDSPGSGWSGGAYWKNSLHQPHPT